MSRTNSVPAWLGSLGLFESFLDLLENFLGLGMAIFVRMQLLSYSPKILLELL